MIFMKNIARKKIIKINFKKFDFTLIMMLISCILFGLIMVFSSSVIMADIRWSKPYKLIIKQLLWVIVGLIIMFITGFLINYKFYKKNSKIIYFVTLISVILVLFIGTSKLGAKRWINIKGFSIQPSEFSKLSIIITLSEFISRKKNIIKKYKGLIAPTIIILLMILPIMLEPDLGTPILIVTVCFAMLFCAEIKINTILMIIIALVLFIIEEIFRKPYRLIRLKDYISSLLNINASSYQIKQSLNAFGSGGLFGKGLGKSLIKIMYLPEAHSDFIFPIIGEELGLLGTSIVSLFFLYLFFKGMKMSKTMPDVFSSFLCLGITFLIVFQAFINMAVTTGIFPTKGLPLPFISSGGTALIINMISAGILINLSQYEKK